MEKMRVARSTAGSIDETVYLGRIIPYQNEKQIFNKTIKLNLDEYENPLIPLKKAVTP